ncbi:MAG: hypothetical protein NXI16_00545 [Alphaproteobacteria bacterium]|nr:hypothetical protein [Alphaproteobacteria bacterium]
MPNEFRFLVFSESEAANALAAFAPKAGKKLPIGSVKGVEVKIDKEPPTAALVIAPDEGGTQNFDFSAGEVTAALIGWCINHKVPLPRDGEKMLEALQGCLALRIGVHPNKPKDEKSG